MEISISLALFLCVCVCMRQREIGFALLKLKRNYDIAVLHFKFASIALFNTTWVQKSL